MPASRASVLRAAALPLLALVTHCGSAQDLVIGELSPIVAEGGSRPMAAGGMGAEPSIAGAAPAGASGTGGSPLTGGSGGDGNEGGAVGAGGEDSGSACPAGEGPPVGSLIHRYDFSGIGTTLVDLVGTANGKLMEGATLDGSGVLTLPGRVDSQPDQYVDLPNGILSSLTEVTLVAWATWEGGAGFQRIFDFGDSSSGEGQGDSGRNYIAMLTTSNFANGNRLGAELAAPGHPTLSLGSYADMDEGTRYQVALVFRSNDHAELFHEATSLITSPVQTSLSELNDVNNWLGRSQWSKDHGFHGSYDEFRIYNVALSACQLATLRGRGPDSI